MADNTVEYLKQLWANRPKTDAQGNPIQEMQEFADGATPPVANPFTLDSSGFPPVDTIANPDELPNLDVPASVVPVTELNVPTPSMINATIPNTPSTGEVINTAVNEFKNNNAQVVPGDVTSAAAHFNYPETAKALGEKVGGALDNDASKGLINTLTSALTGVVKGAANGFQSLSEPINAGVADIRQSIAPLADNPLIKMAGIVAGQSDKAEAAGAISRGLFGKDLTKPEQNQEVINTVNVKAPAMLNDKLEVDSVHPSTIHHTSSGISSDKFKSQRAKIDDLRTRQSQYAGAMATDPYSKSQFDALQSQIDSQTKQMDTDIASDATQRKIDLSFGKDIQGGTYDVKAKDLGEAYNTGMLYLHNAIKFAKQGDPISADSSLAMIPALTKNLTGVKASGQEQAAMAGGASNTTTTNPLAVAASAVWAPFGHMFGSGATPVFNKQDFNSSIKSAKAMLDNVKAQYDANAEQAGATQEQRARYIHTGNNATRNETVLLITDPSGTPITNENGETINVVVNDKGEAVQPQYKQVGTNVILINPITGKQVIPTQIASFGREYNQDKESQNITDKAGINDLLTDKEYRGLLENIKQNYIAKSLQSTDTNTTTMVNKAVAVIDKILGSIPDEKPKADKKDGEKPKANKKDGVKHFNPATGKFE